MLNNLESLLTRVDRSIANGISESNAIEDFLETNKEYIEHIMCITSKCFYNVEKYLIKFSKYIKKVTIVDNGFYPEVDEYDFEIVKLIGYDIHQIRLFLLESGEPYITIEPSNMKDDIWAQAITRELKELSKLIKININTLRKFYSVWRDNLAENLEILNNNRGVKSLFRQFKDKPLVIVAAGPSLDKQLDSLKAYRDNVYIMACTTVLPALKKYSIVPDFIIAIDSGGVITRHLESYFGGLRKQKILYITDPTIQPKTLDYFDDDYIFFIDSEQPVYKYFFIDERFNHGNILKGGTVMSSAIDCAVKLGFDPICFIGLDLAYGDAVGGKEASHTSFCPEESKVDIRKEEALLAEGYFNCKVLTNIMFSGWCRYIEEITHDCRHVKIYDCTEGGIKKMFHHGYMTFKNFLEKFCSDAARVAIDPVVYQNSRSIRDIEEGFNALLNSLSMPAEGTIVPFDIEHNIKCVFGEAYSVAKVKEEIEYMYNNWKKTLKINRS